MISKNDFEKKQLVLLFANHGEKLSFKNDNLVVTDHGGKIKFQSTCYRVFSIFVIGNITITTGLIMRARKFCFSIVLMNGNLRVYDVLGFVAEGNTLLHGRQYGLSQDEQLIISKRIVQNKIANQRLALMRQLIRGDAINEAITSLKNLQRKAGEAKDIQSLMGTEGTAAKLYFPHQFNNCDWKGRRPRAKQDYINATLDIGYTLLFNYIDALIKVFGFDAFKGVLHQEFYQRKSLVCDLVEPFRPVMDLCIRRAISLRQCKEEDFSRENYHWRLPWSKNKEYVLFLVQPLVERRTEVFAYVRDYYRAVSKPTLDETEVPVFKL